MDEVKFTRIELTPVEFGREFDFSFDLLLFVSESQFSKHHTEFVFACIFRVVLILHIWMNISIEKLFVIFVSEHESDALIGCFTAIPKVIVGLNDSL